MVVKKEKAIRSRIYPKIYDPAYLLTHSNIQVFKYLLRRTSFGLKPGMTVLDLGTGAGFYLPYLSKMVLDGGKVYSIENQIPLSNNTIDFTYMAFVFHEMEDPVKFLKELERVNKPISYLALIDWKKEERDKGPPPEEVYSEWEVGIMLEEAGLRVGRVMEVGPYAYGFYAMFVKQ